MDSYLRWFVAYSWEGTDEKDIMIHDVAIEFTASQVLVDFQKTQER